MDKTLKFILRVRRFEKQKKQKYIFKEILQDRAVIGTSNGIGFTKKYEFNSQKEASAHCDELI